MKRTAALLALVLLSGATCAGPAGQPDLSGHGLELSAEASRELDIASLSLRCSCGRHALREGLALRPACPAAVRTLRLGALLANAGATAGDIVGEVKAHQEALAAAPASIHVDEARCKGQATAPLTVVEFTDFQCPACSLARTLIAAAADLAQARLCLGYLPLKSHRDAVPAAEAAEFAREHGRFFELAELLFDHQDALDAGSLREWGKRAGLDGEALGRALAAGTYLSTVQASREEALSLGVKGTPALFLNGRRYTLPLDYAFLTFALENHAALAGRASAKQGAQP